MTAGIDAAIASAFGRKPAASTSESAGWRTGPPGKLTEAEFTARFGTLSSMHSHAQWQEHQRRRAAVEETDRQIAEEQKVLRLAEAHGWDWLRSNSSGELATVAESVKQRLGGSGTQLRESLAGALLDAGMRVRLQEATAVAPRPLTGRRIRVTIATPGMGASGHYGAEVLQAAARERVFPAGLHMMIDHSTPSEQRERPEGSVRDLAGVLTTDARWDDNALVAEAELMPAHADLLAPMANVIGVSLRASGDVEMGEVGGQYVRKITRLIPPAVSVDFVTKAGRGGRFEVLESERPRWDW
ncbi:hypothetical protein [Blastococcus sp. TF02A-35]|uniref:hypothetical protein n=1 Tax=Blastococcus sp. TF02A-35 TaxID=2559612 RepID=UPI001072F626|nr:hypothetical protein [Blastococcus sp. TF02A_35]TFV49537.1 hypothetical protein E4P43_11860 [Blastococcus sp. TF02A_35]